MLMFVLRVWLKKFKLSTCYIIFLCKIKVKFSLCVVEKILGLVSIQSGINLRACIPLKKERMESIRTRWICVPLLMLLQNLCVRVHARALILQ